MSLTPREVIFAPSKAFDAMADRLLDEVQLQRAEAKKARWAKAPAWANCIVGPSKYILKGIERGVHTQLDASRPADVDDWRWAKHERYGWIYFNENHSMYSTLEASNWVVKEWRHDTP